MTALGPFAAVIAASHHVHAHGLAWTPTGDVRGRCVWTHQSEDVRLACDRPDVAGSGSCLRHWVAAERGVTEAEAHEWIDRAIWRLARDRRGRYWPLADLRRCRADGAATEGDWRMTAPDPLADMIEQTYRESRRDGMSIAATSQMIASVIRAEVLDRIAVTEAEGLSRADHVMVQSVVGAASGTPTVQCRVGYEQWQWDVEQAREHAMALLTAAEAAIHDAAVLRWLTLGEIGLDRDAAMRAVVDLRRFRGDVAREDWRPPSHEDPS